MDGAEWGGDNDKLCGTPNEACYPVPHIPLCTSMRLYVFIRICIYLKHIGVFINISMGFVCFSGYLYLFFSCVYALCFGNMFIFRLLRNYRGMCVSYVMFQ